MLSSVPASLLKGLKSLMQPTFMKIVLVPGLMILALSLSMFALTTSIIEPERQALPSSVTLVMPQGPYFQELNSKVTRTLESARKNRLSRNEFEKSVINLFKSQEAVASVQVQSHLLGTMRIHIQLHRHAMRMTDKSNIHYFFAPSLKLIGYSTNPEKVLGLASPELKLNYDGLLQTRKTDPSKVFSRGGNSSPIPINLIYRNANNLKTAVENLSPAIQLEPPDTVTLSPDDGFSACLKSQAHSDSTSPCTRVRIGHVLPSDIAQRLKMLVSSRQLENAQEIDMRIEGRALIEDRVDVGIAETQKEARE